VNYKYPALDAFAIREAAVASRSRRKQLACNFPINFPIDPTERFLIATARILGLILVTADEAIVKSRTVTVVANR
jgi:PIN domain nuclease of toxin-antitoxin system